MRILAISVALAMFTTSALATGTTPPTLPPSNPVQNFFANLEARAQANQAQKQAQQQAQAQQQGQGQSQIATGGNANNNNNVNVDNRQRNVYAPPVYGNGDTYAGSVAIAGFAGGIAVPSRAHGRGKIGDNIIRLSPSRAALYTQCGLPHTDQSLTVMGIRCELKGQALYDYELQYVRVKTVVHKPRATRPANHRPRKRCGC